MNLADTTPLWPAEWTAIGTVALAAVTVAAIITTIVILRRRHWARYGMRSGEARLAERYANGEIDEQEYKNRLAVLKDQS